MAEAEFEGQKAMSAIIPDNVANPIGWGHCKDDETKDWYLVPFLELRSRPPSKMHLLEVLQTLHQRSQSPTGKFGFHVAPFNGGAPVVADWADNWEDFWTRDFLKQVAYLQQNRGDDPELAELAARFTEVVIPRLLRPLQTGGRNIKPCLLHGDLWDENVHTVPNTSTQTMKPMLFDPCPLYGHWEMDMQHLRTKRFAIGLDFIELYRSAAIDKSQPEDDFDDRIALYAM
jgi:fructosamine-3-kinase